MLPKEVIYLFNNICFYNFRPPKGSQSECRANKATIHVCKEMLELCEVINQNGERLFSEKEKPEDPRKVISFGELFHVSTRLKNDASRIIFLLHLHISNGAKVTQ